MKCSQDLTQGVRSEMEAVMIPHSSVPIAGISEKRLQPFRSREMAARFAKAIVKQTSGCFRKTARIHAMFFNYETYSGFVNFSQMADGEEGVSLRSQSE